MRNLTPVALYWGLRDYGTGTWTGGDPDCAHIERLARKDADFNERTQEQYGKFSPAMAVPPGIEYRAACPCGARRVDDQLGLEATPTAYVAKMVEVFREVWRVLRDDGTLWLNIGDSYNTAQAGNTRPTGISQKNGRWDGGAVKHSRGLVDSLKPKDLVGIPWRLAFALQADGWYLRSDIIWAKPNPMPESVTDRPTKAHEYVFLFSKQPRYFWDQDAVREPLLESSIERGRYGHSSFGKGQFNGSPTDERHQDGKDVRLVADLQNPAGRNLRSVWQIATQPFPEAHFATYPEELVRRCILAGTSERGGCVECGAPWRRVTESKRGDMEAIDRPKHLQSAKSGLSLSGNGSRAWVERGAKREVKGWLPSCSCRFVQTIDAHLQPTRPQLVLDPFVGSGTTALVARKHGRHSIGIDLSAEYLTIAARRTRQLSLLGAAW